MFPVLHRKLLMSSLPEGLWELHYPSPPGRTWDTPRDLCPWEFVVFSAQHLGAVNGFPPARNAPPQVDVATLGTLTVLLWKPLKKEKTGQMKDGRTSNFSFWS